jgi:phospholipid/cholesterol/gamma-HCH transport system permease protein
VTAVLAPEAARLPRRPRVRQALAALGRACRVRSAFALTIGALALGVIRELPQRSSWRRPVRAEFARALRQSVGGGLPTTLVAAALIGIAMVYQALFWLSEAGEERLIGSILVPVLLREVAPLIVGLILLGRDGAAATTEIGRLQLSGQVGRLAAQGIDPFLLLVLPRATALSLACYTLGVVFVLAALAIGFVVGSLAGGVPISAWNFMATVLGAMRPRDFAVFPAKMLAIGLLVALTSVLTGLTVRPGEDANQLLPRSFVRGMLAVMLTSVTLSLAV